MRNFSKLGAVLTVVLTLALSGIHSKASAQIIPTGQSAGALEHEREEARKSRKIDKKLMTPKEEADVKGKEEVIPKEAKERSGLPKEKVLIKKIDVTGVTAISNSVVRGIVSRYEGRELLLEDFGTIAEEITSAYREKGYVTSIAYLPPQKITDNTLVINVAEGAVGNIKMEGNRYFSSKLLSSYLDMKKGDIFNYDLLRQNITDINSHPDRNARVVLAKGEGRGESDVNILVNEKFPFHMLATYNNYNSDYLYRNKYQMEMTTTNLWGRDHIFSAEYQFGEGGAFNLYSARYLAPLGSELTGGVNYINLYQKLGGSVKALDIRGTGNILTAFYSYKVIKGENFSLNVSTAFDCKNIENKILGVVNSRDFTRVLKAGFDLDMTDFLNGRTIVTQEFDVGLPGFMGGLKAKDSRASVVGSGGEFFISSTNAARIQALPYSLTLMLKGAMQLSDHTLPASQQFNIGGPTTVRGYPVSEFTGDNGYTATAELYVPPYLLPKDIKVPYTKTTLYDATRFVGFFDWGLINNRRPQVGEPSSKSLYGFGGGVRFDVPGLNSTALDLAYGCAGKPSDNDRFKIYISTRIFFN